MIDPSLDTSTVLNGNIWQVVGFAVSSLMFGGTLGTLWLRKRVASDAASIANDRAEVDIIKTLQEENRELRISLKEVNAEREKLALQMAEMTATLKIMENKLDFMNRELSSLRAELGRNA